MNIFKKIFEVASGPIVEPFSIQGRQFHVKEQLGEGGFAFVYKVVDPSTSEMFAVKMMCIQNSEQESKFKQEVAIHREIQHRNVLPLLGFSLRPSTKRPRTKEGLLLFPLCKVGSRTNKGTNLY